MAFDEWGLFPDVKRDLPGTRALIQDAYLSNPFGGLREEMTKVAKQKERELVHYFKVAVAQDPRSSDAALAERDLTAVDGVVSVEFVRSAMRVVHED